MKIPNTSSKESVRAWMTLQQLANKSHSNTIPTIEEIRRNVGWKTNK